MQRKIALWSKSANVLNLSLSSFGIVTRVVPKQHLKITWNSIQAGRTWLGKVAMKSSQKSRLSQRVGKSQRLLQSCSSAVKDVLHYPIWMQRKFEAGYRHQVDWKFREKNVSRIQYKNNLSCNIKVLDCIFLFCCSLTFCCCKANLETLS